MKTTARPADMLVAAAAAGWVVVTALSQHPSRAFDRFRKFDPTGVVLPNWRFFAPEPSMHDFRVLHRLRRPDGSVGAWTETTTLQRRRAAQAIWFPDRRRDKAVSDICNEIVTVLSRSEPDVTRFPAYRLLRDHVADTIRTGGDQPAGFQFLVARVTGYDESFEPEYLFASPYEAWAQG